MFYTENGIPHYRCEECGEIDNIKRVTIERWVEGVDIQQQIPYADMRGDAECVDCSDVWMECGNCGLHVPDCTNDYELGKELERIAGCQFSSGSTVTQIPE